MARSSTITVRILGDTKGLSKALSESEGKVSGFKSVGSKIGGGLMTAAKGALAAAGGGAALLAGIAIKKGMTRLMGIENATAKLKGLGHSANAVEKIMGNALDSVRGTAFGLDEAATTAASAVAAGIKPGKDLTKYLTLTADAATIAGTSMDEMGGIINKVTTAGKAQADNLNQLADRGIPIFQWLAKEYGVSATALSEMVRKGEVDAKTFRKVIGENIGGAALESGNTTQGAWNNMMAAMGRIGANFLSGVFPMFKEGFTGIIELLAPLEDKAKLLGAAFGEFARMAIEGFIALLPTLQLIGSAVVDFVQRGIAAFQALMIFLQPAIDQVKTWFGGLGTEGPSRLQPIIDFIQGRLIPGLMGVVDAVKGWLTTIIPIYGQIVSALMSSWSKIQPYVASVWNSVKEIISGVLAIIKRVVELITAAISAVWSRWGDDILRFVKTAFEAVAQTISGVMKAISGIIKLVLAVLKGDWKGAWDAIKQIVSGVWDAIKGILKAAAAAVVLILSGAWELVKAGVSSAWNAIVRVVSREIAATVAEVKTIKDKIVGFFAGAGDWLVDAGRAILEGLGAGIDAAKDWVMGKINAIADSIPGWLKKRLGIASPSKVTAKIGRQIVQGLGVGMEDSRADLRSALAAITETVTEALKKMHKDSDALVRAGIVSLKDEKAALLENAAARDKVTGALGRARDALKAAIEDQRNYAAAIRESIASYGNVTGVGKDDEGLVTAGSIVAGLREKVRSAREFSDLMGRLTKMGLNKTTLDQLAQAGVEGGLATAKALAEGGEASVRAVNRTTRNLDKTARDLGQKVSKTMHGAGVKAGKKLVNGLESQESRLIAVANRMAQQMMNAITSALNQANVALGAGATAKKVAQAGPRQITVKSPSRPKLTESTSGKKAKEREEELVRNVKGLREDIKRLPKQYKVNERTGGKKK